MSVRIDAAVKTNVNYAICQHKKDLVSGLTVTGVHGSRIPVRISGSPEFIADEGLFYAVEGERTEPCLSLDNQYFQYNVIEGRQACVNIEVLDPADERTVLGRRQFPVELQAYLHWDGTAAGSYSLAMFVTPASRRVKELVEKARKVSGEYGCGFDPDPAVNAGRVYKEGDADYAYMIAESVYTALEEEQIIYMNPPASFDRGQKVRIPEYVLSERGRQGTCLDLAVLMAACLEAAGLYSGVVLVPGHAFAGVWLKEPDESWVKACTRGAEAAWRINLACREGKFLPIECTTFTMNSHVNFSEAAEEYGREELREFEELIDMKMSRKAGMLPAFQDLDESIGMLDSFYEKAAQPEDSCRIGIEADVAPVINFARDFRGDRLVRNLIVSGTAGIRAGVRIYSDSGFISLREPDFSPALNGLAFQPHVMLDADYYRQNINAAAEDEIIIEVFDKEDRSVLETRSYDVKLMPYMFWDAGKYRDSLPAFVQPNAPVLAPVLTRAGRLCENWGISFSGYQVGSPRAVLKEVEFLYQAIREEKIGYEELQPGYENRGQVIRIPEYLLKESGRKANSLDLAVLFASCLEEARLHGILIIQKQRVLVGAWLLGTPLKDYLLGSEAAEILYRHAADGHLAVFDCMDLSYDRGQVSFAEAMAKGRQYISETVYAQDITVSRQIGIDPVFPFSDDPICSLPADMEDDEEDDELIREVLDNPSPARSVSKIKRNVVFCILQGDSSSPVSRHINSSLQWMQEFYRARRDTSVREAFVYHKTGVTSAKGFMPLEKQENFFIDLSGETHKSVYTSLTPLYYMALAMLEDQWRTDGNTASYELVIILNKNIEKTDAEAIFRGCREWKMPYRVNLIHNKEANIDNLKSCSDRYNSNWHIYRSDDLEKGDCYGDEFDI